MHKIPFLYYYLNDLFLGLCLKQEKKLPVALSLLKNKCNSNILCIFPSQLNVINFKCVHFFFSLKKDKNTDYQFFCRNTVCFTRLNACNFTQLVYILMYFITPLLQQCLFSLMDKLESNGRTVFCGCAEDLS